MRSGLGFLLLAALLVIIAPPAFSQRLEPGGTANDVNLAVQEPYEYAWRLFLFLNQQAMAGAAGVADPAKSSIKHYDPDTDVVWETWAVATGGLFLRPGEIILVKFSKTEVPTRDCGSICLAVRARPNILTPA